MGTEMSAQRDTLERALDALRVALTAHDLAMYAGAGEKRLAETRAGRLETGPVGVADHRRGDAARPSAGQGTARAVAGGAGDRLSGKEVTVDRRLRPGAVLGLGAALAATLLRQARLLRTYPPREHTRATIGARLGYRYGRRVYGMNGPRACARRVRQLEISDGTSPTPGLVSPIRPKPRACRQTAIARARRG